MNARKLTLILALIPFSAALAAAEPVNLVARVSAAALQAMAKDVDETTQLSQSSSAGLTHGTVSTKGTVHVELVPDPDRVSLDLHFHGVSRAPHLVTEAKPRVRVFTAATIALDGHKSATLDAEGLATSPARARAVTDLRLLDVQAPPVIRLIAYRKAQQSLPQAARETSAAAARELATKLDGEAEPILGELGRLFDESFKKPFTTLGVFPRLFLSTTDKEISIAAGFGHEAPATPPPAPAGSHDGVFSIHEGMLNHVCGATLSAKTFTRAEFKALLEKLTLGVMQGELPEGLDFSVVTFDSVRPFTVTFANERLRINSRMRKVTFGNDEYTDIEMTGKFKLVVTAKGPELVRDGDIEVKPLGPAAATWERLSTGGPSRVALSEPSLPGAPFKILSLSAAKGWITATVKLDPKP